MATWLKYIIETSRNKHRLTIYKIHRRIHSKVTYTSTSLIEGPSIDLWWVVGHLQIPFRDTWWTCARCAKNLTEMQFWIPSNPTSMFGHGKYGNANHIPTVCGFLCINDLMLLLSCWAIITSILFCFRIFIINDQWTWVNDFIFIF